MQRFADAAPARVVSCFKCFYWRAHGRCGPRRRKATRRSHSGSAGTVRTDVARCIAMQRAARPRSTAEFFAECRHGFGSAVTLRRSASWPSYASGSARDRHERSGRVPKPAMWALMIAGFGLTGAMLRRRRAVIAA